MKGLQPLDATAMRYAASGETIVMMGADMAYEGPLDPTYAHEEDEFAAAAVLADQIAKDGYTPELENLAEALYEQQAEADAKPVRDGRRLGVAMFSEADQARIRRGTLVLDQDPHAAAALAKSGLPDERPRFGPLERRLIDEGLLEVADSAPEED
jgi:hypothetical protein